MSRNIKEVNGEYIITIEDMDACKHCYDDFCTNDKSPFLADFCCPDYCDCFEEEDGVICEEKKALF